MKPTKPLGIKAYGSIGHLPNSRIGVGDHVVPPGQARICCERTRDSKDVVIVQEKLDGACVAVAKIHDEIVPLGRVGYPWYTSPHQHVRAFGDWALTQEDRFYHLLHEGERIVGEWLALAHGTKYELWHEPFVPFDIMTGHERLTVDAFLPRVSEYGFVPPQRIKVGPGALSVSDAMSRLQGSKHGAVDEIEGAVWRVERNGKVDFLAKYVRPDKVDGCYLPEISGQPAVWNWQPWESWTQK